MAAKIDMDLEAELEALEVGHENMEVKNLVEVLRDESEEKGGTKKVQNGAQDKVDYRVYYDGIEHEFKRSEDCEFSFRELKMDSPDLVEVIEKMNTFIEHLKSECTEHGPQMLCTKQSNVKWMELRKERVTSSGFGRIAKRKKIDPPESMLKFMQKNLNPVKYQGDIESLHYGRLLESNGVKRYQSANPESQVKETGIWVNSQFPWMGGSPDGIVFDRIKDEEGLLEVKCPLRGKGSDFASVVDQKGFYMLKDKDGKYTLDKKNEYYYQIQGCLSILNKEFCDFVISTGYDIYVERIKKDDEFFKAMKRKLREYYYRFMLPYLANRPVLEGRKWQYTFVSKEVYENKFSEDDK